MSINLNHTIVHTRDKQASAEFLAELFGLPTPKPFGPFLAVQVNDVTLDYFETDEVFPVQHHAFLVGEQDFDTIFERIQERQLPYWADPRKQQAGRINHHDGGRGVYFEDPTGAQLLEIITRPYGTGG